jgi:hypothetical protein
MTHISEPLARDIVGFRIELGEHFAEVMFPAGDPKTVVMVMINHALREGWQLTKIFREA